MTTSSSAAGTRPTYPATARGPVVDDYHGTPVADPYRWLEDIEAPATSAWIAEQNALTEAFVAAVPQRAAIRAHLERVWDYERRGVPWRAGPWYVGYRNSGLQNQPVVVVQTTLDGDARVLFDPNALSDDGTIALTGLAFSEDGALAAYATSASGSDWLTWRVRDVAGGTDLPDELTWSKFSSAAWRHDNSGFYYARYAAPADDADALRATNYDHEVYFHRLGTAQADDVLVYARPDHPDWHLGAMLTDDGVYLIVGANLGTDPRSGIFVAPVERELDRDAWIALAEPGVAEWDVLGNDGERFYFRTTLDAPRGRIVARDLRGGRVAEIVPHGADVLEGASLFGDTLIVRYLHDAHTVVRIFGLDGTVRGDVPLPGLGTAAGFDGKRDAAETFFAYTSYTQAASIYRYGVATNRAMPLFVPEVAFDAADFVSEQVFATSRDGTRVPVILTHRRGLARDATAPVILYGYGGFNISLTPAFSPAVATWIAMGGVYAVANLRGGGEYGAAWHEAGMFERKQNVFDDAFAVAEWLIDNRVTTSARLAIMGGSNGGLLVGACMTQRPELFAAALPAVGVMDMLRFQHFTIGWAWTHEYGCADDATAFAYLYAYSPLHRLRDGVAYPATLVSTADHDDRVYPAHSFKFTAALQYAQSGDAPALIRVEQKAGHGTGKPTAKMIDEAADRFAFLVRVLDVTPAL